MPRILSESENTTGKGLTDQNEEQPISPSTMLGGRRIDVEAALILSSLEQLTKVFSLEPHVRDAVVQKALHTTTTMTDLLRLLGSVNRATSNDTKN